MNTLRKYKKNELIDLLLEYETEINELKLSLTSLRLDLEQKEDEIQQSSLERTRSGVMNKTIEYLVKRIRTINEPSRKLIYVLELERMNKLIQ